MVPICYTSSSVFRFQAEKKKLYEHFDNDDHMEVSKINDDDNGIDIIRMTWILPFVIVSETQLSDGIRK